MAVIKKKYKVDVDPPTRKKIERFARETRRKHIDVVGLAMDALIERESQKSAVRQEGTNAASTAA
jgi:hypothetical protein